jgi:hypothetical protein
MTKPPSNLLAFPSTNRSLCSADFLLPDCVADAEMRADMVRALLSQLADIEGTQPLDLRARLLCYAAQELVDEMVVLYRRALGASSARA